MAPPASGMLDAGAAFTGIPTSYYTSIFTHSSFLPIFITSKEITRIETFGCMVFFFPVYLLRRQSWVTFFSLPRFWYSVLILPLFVNFLTISLLGAPYNLTCFITLYSKT